MMLKKISLRRMIKKVFDEGGIRLWMLDGL